MAIETTCSNCQTTWVVVPGILKAHPGRRSETVAVRVPDKDVFGRTHGTILRESSRWISAGPSAVLEHTQDDQWSIYTWACLCGAPMEYRTARWYVVACQHNAGDTGMCWKAATRKNPPADFYVNPRYGAACPCCGQQGTHMVTLGNAAPCGATA